MEKCDLGEDLTFCGALLRSSGNSLSKAAGPRAKGGYPRRAFSAIIKENKRSKEAKNVIKGFKMKLYPGQEAEYERRHNLLWPEMKDMIHAHGGKNYSIFLDRQTLTLYGVIEIEDEALWAAGADTAINRKWWDYMADIMETNPDNSPVSEDLKLVFHLD